MKKTSRVFIASILSASMLLLFSGCKKESEFKYTLNEDGQSYTLSAYKGTSADLAVVIPDTYLEKPVTAIGQFVFQNEAYIKDLTIGKNIVTIDPYAIMNDSSLETIVVDPENKAFSSVDGVLFNKEKTVLLRYPLAKGVDADNVIKSYTVPDTVKEIAPRAFYRCLRIVEIKLPDGLTVLNEKAFFRNEKLETVILPSTLTAIGKDAFAFCSSLPSITVPDSVVQIDAYAFYRCKSNPQTVVTMMMEKDVAANFDNNWDKEGGKIVWAEEGEGQ